MSIKSGDNILTCPTCQGYLAFRPSYHILNGEEVLADIRCVHCGTSVIYTTHIPIEEEKGSGYNKEDSKKKTCLCGCKKKFIDRSSAQNKKFFDTLHRTKYYNLKAQQKGYDEEDRRVARIKGKWRETGK